MRPSADHIPPVEKFCSLEAEAMASRPIDKLVKDIGIGFQISGRD